MIPHLPVQSEVILPLPILSEASCPYQSTVRPAYLPEVVSLPQPGHGVDEAGGEVQAEPPLAGAVVVGEGVVVVVVALADGQY